MKNLAAITISVVLFSFAQASNAEISVEDLPDFGNLAKLIGEADQSEVTDAVYDQDRLISTGMTADDSMRGNTAEKIAAILSDGNTEQQEGLEGGIEQLRTAFEESLVGANFAMNDVGVGMAVSFISFWELASEKTLAPEAALEVGKFLVQTFEPMSSDERFMALSDSVKASAYDWLMTAPVAFSGLVQTLESQGKIDEAKALRDKSASLFTDLFKMPPTLITISDKGEINLNIDGIQSYQEDSGLSEDW